MAETPVRAGIYARMSLAVMNDDTKVEDQARISRELAAGIRWQVAPDCGYPRPDGTYTDNSRSAWQRNRRRPAWDAMLADVKAGRLDAIIVYHGDRLVRQPFDLETLIGLADGQGIRLASPTGMRDLDNTDDRFVLRILCAQACMESDNTSRRKKTQYERMRREGKVRAGGRGGRAYGFAPDGITQVPGEAKVIREMARRVLNGEGAGVIAAALNTRGLRTVTRGHWAHGTIRKMLARPRYAGLMPDGKQQAAWKPVLRRETWELVCATLEGRAAGFGYVTNVRKYLLSGIAECGTCRSPVAIRHSKRSGLGYGCIHPGCPRKLHRNAEYMDVFIRAFMIAYLSSPELDELLRDSPDPGLAAEIISLERRRGEAQRQLENLAGHPGLNPVTAARAIASFDERLAVLVDRAGQSSRRRLLGTHRGFDAAMWDRLPLGTRRALISAAVRIEILPAKRGPGFDSDSVRITPRRVENDTG